MAKGDQMPSTEGDASLTGQQSARRRRLAVDGRFSSHPKIVPWDSRNVAEVGKVGSGDLMIVNEKCSGVAGTMPKTSQGKPKFKHRLETR